ncbi:hypothetical protein F5Y13DRAFT_167033 [Hypoxylon sp. FL1857]|nr:hypothetical protein F5Y13DRAFT_167033 [Hypoxylon sp. FL1857]
MGGNAFATGDKPLYTPRMPPTVYRHVLKDCHAKLQELFDTVKSPVPGPAKEDYGDVDIYLTWDKDSPIAQNLLSSLSPSTRNPLEAAAHMLNAERYLREQPNAIITAIPWPEDLPQEAKDEGPKQNGNVKAPRYIQVDLHLFDSVKQCEWMIFKHAHGDLWNLLGRTIRPFGLTINDNGLNIRIPEIETLDKKKSKILLSTDPAQVLNFLGLKNGAGQWDGPFASEKDLFEYAATCRLFWVRPEQDENSAVSDGGEIDKRKFKANDRRRMHHRPVFRRWVDEFLPACRKAGRFATQTATRDSIRKEAFETFPGTQKAYEARVTEWRKERQQQTLWNGVIKKAIPKPAEGEEKRLGNPHWRSSTAGALKKIIMKEDYSLGIRPPEALRDVDGMYDEDRVREFVEDYWLKVGNAAWKENQRRYAEYQAEKTAKGETSG